MSDIHALSGAYAVDALDADERAEFERHLAECATCRAEVESLQETAALLAETTTAPPPAALRARLLADITTVRPLPPELPQTQGRHDNVVPLAPRRRRFAAFVAAAAAVVAIGGGAVVWQQLDDGPPSMAEQIQAADDMQKFTVPVDRGEATLYRSPRLNEAVIVTHGMPTAPEGHTFALWLQHDEVMVPAGVMPSGADNEVVLSGDVASADGFGITVEDAGEEPATPSDEVVALVDFDA